MSAIKGVPHPFPYQGSKRQQASQILDGIPNDTVKLIEPFVGSGAITIATAYLRKAQQFHINDAHEPLIDLWKEIIHNPNGLVDNYEVLWHEQKGQERSYYVKVRDSFNETQEPSCFLYLLARCVKAAVRYNAQGKFNNSPDNRRRGMRPEKMRQNIMAVSELLRDKVAVSCKSYQDILATADSECVVYMDPPYQGVRSTRDQRYCKGVEFERFVDSLELLNRRNVPFIVSYDGKTGDKVHGKLLPQHLQLKRLEIPVGHSTQATLLGRKSQTIESLYLSKVLLERLACAPIESLNHLCHIAFINRAYTWNS